MAALDDPRDIVYRENNSSVELDISQSVTFSINVSSAGASVADCWQAVQSAPDTDYTLTDLQAGLVMCFAVFPNNVTNQPNGLVKVQITQPIDSSGGLHLRETYWTVQN